MSHDAEAARTASRTPGKPATRSRAVVFGSLNLDYVVRVARAPAAGETIEASGLSTASGGKGANQAIAVARLGVETAMVGCVGDDSSGQRICSELRAAGVNDDCVRRVAGVPSGSAFVVLEASGENRIVIAAGANGEVGDVELSRLRTSLADASVLLLQFEVPLRSVAQAARIARTANVTVVLDPAPARPFPHDLVGLVDILTPNESEAAFLTGRTLPDDASAIECAAALRALTRAATIIIKRGANGAIVDSGNGPRIVRAPHVAAVDTTAAGDTFNGALGASICDGASIDEAIDRATIAGAVSVTKPGGQQSIPTREEIREFMRRLRAAGPDDPLGDVS